MQTTQKKPDKIQLDFKDLVTTEQYILMQESEFSRNTFKLVNLIKKVEIIASRNTKPKLLTQITTRDARRVMFSQNRKMQLVWVKNLLSTMFCIHGH